MARGTAAAPALARTPLWAQTRPLRHRLRRCRRRPAAVGAAEFPHPFRLPREVGFRGPSDGAQYRVATQKRETEQMPFHVLVWRRGAFTPGPSMNPIPLLRA